MEINDEILETISRERCARARDILRRSGIVEAWRDAGAQVEIVGSLRMGLMMKHRDIDLHIYSAPLDARSQLCRYVAHSRMPEHRAYRVPQPDGYRGAVCGVACRVGGAG